MYNYRIREQTQYKKYSYKSHNSPLAKKTELSSSSVVIEGDSHNQGLATIIQEQVIVKQRGPWYLRHRSASK